MKQKDYWSVIDNVSNIKLRSNRTTPEQFTKRNLDLLRSLFNGESVNIEGTKYNLGDTLKKKLWRYRF